MDGTLVDSLPILKKTFFDFLKKYGIQSNEEEFQFFNGMELSEIVLVLMETYDLKKNFKELYDEYVEQLYYFYTKEVTLFPGAQEFLEMIKRKKMKIAIVTSAELSLAKLCLHSTGISSFMDILITPTEQFRGKPSPDMYLEALNQLKIAREDAVVIEDSENGVQAAVSAKINTFHIFSTSNKAIHYKTFQVIPVKNWQQIIDFFRD